MNWYNINWNWNYTAMQVETYTVVQSIENIAINNDDKYQIHIYRWIKTKTKIEKYEY